MNKPLENLYSYLLAHREEVLTDIDCINNVEGVNPENIMQLLEALQSKRKIRLDCDSYIRPSITVI